MAWGLGLNFYSPTLSTLYLQFLMETMFEENKQAE